MLLAAGREVVSKTSAYNITKLSYRVEVRVSDKQNVGGIKFENKNTLKNSLTQVPTIICSSFRCMQTLTKVNLHGSAYFPAQYE